MKLLAIAACAILLAPGSAWADTLVVSEEGDSGAGSLRQTIADAAGGDTIEFSGVSTVTLSAGTPITIDKDLVIDGGAGVTIDADNTSSILLVTSAASLDVNDVTFLNGSGGYGAAIENRGDTVNIVRCTFTGNSAFNAGALGNFGTMNVVQSTLVGNSTTGNSGAGFVNSGTMHILNSTISGNMTTGGNRVGGAGAQSGGESDPVLTITNSTIAGNSATGLGGGIYSNDASLIIKNSIFADNTAPGGPDIWGEVVSADYNLIEDPTDANISGETDHNITGVDPGLMPLADNGGATQTHAIDNTSPAWGSASCADIDENPVTLDQRGETRPAAGCSMGAFEGVVAETCADSVLNQDETDVDCGGEVCDPCQEGESCLLAADCESGQCTEQVCVASVASASCTDGVMNQDETGIDCGGANCDACVSEGSGGCRLSRGNTPTPLIAFAWLLACALWVSRRSKSR